MGIYAVRDVENGEFVGIFAVNNLSRLMFVVDECTDPGSCEYLTLPEGGIMLESWAPSIPVVMDMDDEEEQPANPLDGASFSEGWWEKLFVFKQEKKRAKWKPVIQ